MFRWYVHHVSAVFWSFFGGISVVLWRCLGYFSVLGGVSASRLCLGVSAMFGRCPTPSMRCGRLPSRSDVNNIWRLASIKTVWSSRTQSLFGEAERDMLAKKEGKKTDEHQRKIQKKIKDKIVKRIETSNSQENEKEERRPEVVVVVVVVALVVVVVVEKTK